MKRPNDSSCCQEALEQQVGYDILRARHIFGRDKVLKTTLLVILVQDIYFPVRNTE